MIQGVSEATSMTIFNGLTRSPDQEGLLAYAHGASIEFFGLNDRTNREPTFNDLALDLVRYRTARGRLTLWYRTSDPSARVEVVVEVDDRDRVLRFALVDGPLEIGGDHAPRPAQFRAVPSRASQFARLRVVGGGAPMIADGQWHSLILDLDAACAAGRRYESRRAVFARLRGLDGHQACAARCRGRHLQAAW
jgi:hypothetical protein